MGHHLLESRRLLPCALQFAFELAQRDDLVCLRLFPRAIDLQVAENDGSLAVLLEKNKRVRDKEPRGVKHVGIVLARRDDQASFVFRFLSGAHLTFLSANPLLVIPSRARRRGTSQLQIALPNIDGRVSQRKRAACCGSVRATARSLAVFAARDDKQQPAITSFAARPIGALPTGAAESSEASPSRPSVDPINTTVLKTKTFTFIPRYRFSCRRKHSTSRPADNRSAPSPRSRLDRKPSGSHKAARP